MDGDKRLEDKASVSFIKKQSTERLNRLKAEGNYGAIVELFIREHRTVRFLTIDKLIDELNR